MNRGLSQFTACMRLHIGLRTLQYYEAGERVPPVDTVRRMSVIYGCPVEELIFPEYTKERAYT